MPKIYKPGNRIHTYTVTAEVNRGGMAVAYKARARDGQHVFLKQYKSPTNTVAWYEQYKVYQDSLKRRIEASPCKSFCYRFVDVFEFEKCFFQAFEFLDRSNSLEEVLHKCRRNPNHANEEQRMIMAKVLMSGIAALHQQKIVHSDLKPANIMLIWDKTISARYRLRIIDMDFSLLVDQQAPWHGDRGYFGTPGYLSPEHLCAEVPQPASDVFTLGLMLHELLGKGHPYQFEDEADYQRACLKHVARPIDLFGSLAALPFADRIKETVHQCLAPDAGRRPTSMEVNRVLNDLPSDSRPAPEPRRPEPPEVEVRPRPAPALAGLRLRSNNGVEKVFNISTPIGRRLVRPFGDDSQFFDDVQFTLEKDEKGWSVVPNNEAKNQTFLNGEKITAAVGLKEGDVLAVGSETKKITKLPLIVSFGSAG